MYRNGWNVGNVLPEQRSMTLFGSHHWVCNNGWECVLLLPAQKNRMCLGKKKNPLFSGARWKEDCVNDLSSHIWCEKLNSSSRNPYSYSTEFYKYWRHLIFFSQIQNRKFVLFIQNVWFIILNVFWNGHTFDFCFLPGFLHEVST